MASCGKEEVQLFRLALLSFCLCNGGLDLVDTNSLNYFIEAKCINNLFEANCIDNLFEANCIDNLFEANCTISLSAR